ncbi:unnamed protein product [Penicillium palitans]
MKSSRSSQVAQEIPRGGLGIGNIRSDPTILPMSVRRLTTVPGRELDFMGLADDNGRRMAIRQLRVILWFANSVLSVLRSSFFGDPGEI